MTKSRLSLVALVLSALILAPLSAVHAAGAAIATFVLNARVLDGGQQVVSLTLDVGDEKIDAASLTADTFAVHATATNPYHQLDSSKILGLYDVDRVVTGAHLDGRGRIVVRMTYGPTVKGASTIAYSTQVERNIIANLEYTITQKAPVKTVSGDAVTFASFHQLDVVDPEVDAFALGRSASGLEYGLYTPASASPTSKKPLVLFLHGGGEGGWSGAYDAKLPVLANRGGVSFATKEAQRIFGGAYVVVPQAWTRWLDDASFDYTTKLKKLVDELVRTKNIDRRRIHIIGPSNGGFMAMKMVSTYPRFFATNVPVCPAFNFPGMVFLTDDQIRAMRPTPTWFVQAKNDPVVPYTLNALHAHQVMGNSRLTAYPNVVWGGHEYNGHWSWIQVARNHPSKNGESLWEWMAKTRLKTS